MGDTGNLTARLHDLAADVASLHSQLILLVAPPGSGKTALLGAYANQRGAPVLAVGASLGAALAALPRKQRPLQAGTLLRELAAPLAGGKLPLLLDNLELLFDASLRLNPILLLKNLARGRVVVAAWPGEVRQTTHGTRLIYARRGHPEYREEGVEGLFTLVITRPDL